MLIYSSTIAQHIAEAAPAGRPIIFDVMCGVGGNTIAFALSGKWKRVYAIEKHEATLRPRRQRLVNERQQYRHEVSFGSATAEHAKR